MVLHSPPTPSRTHQTPFLMNSRSDQTPLPTPSRSHQTPLLMNSRSHKTPLPMLSRSHEAPLLPPSDLVTPPTVSNGENGPNEGDVNVRRSSRSTKGVPPARLNDNGASTSFSQRPSTVSDAPAAAANLYSSFDADNSTIEPPATISVNAAANLYSSFGADNSAIEPPATISANAAADHQLNFRDADNEPRRDLESSNAALKAQLLALQTQFASLMSQMEANMHHCPSATPSESSATSAVQPHQASVNATDQPGPSYVSTRPQPMPYSSHRPKLYDLPMFSGVPEEWPMFIASFNESTSAYGYTALENMLRLQKSLKGPAREAVETMLIHPSNVHVVIDQLQFRFGRPEHLIRSQMAKVRLLPTISDNRQDLIVPFATKVENLCTLLESTKSQQHLANPMLLDELVSKLPMSKRLDWAQFSDDIQPYPSVKDFCAWLQKYARLVSIATHSQYQQAANPHRGSRQSSVLHAVEKNMTSTDVKFNKVCTMCSQKHNLSQCPAFLQMSLTERWNVVKGKRVCFACLVPGHLVSACRSRKRCGEDGCSRFHHIVLHEKRQPEAAAVIIANPEPEVNHHAHAANAKKVLFRVLPVNLYGPKGVVSTFALLDDGSSVTIINNTIASQLGLTGTAHKMTLTWIGQKGTSEPSALVNLEISGVADGSTRYAMKNVRTHSDLSLPMQTMNVSKLTVGNEVRSLPIYEFKNAVPQILIGLDNWRLTLGRTTVPCGADGPVAVETLLGWVVYGGYNSGKEISDSVYHISGDNNSIANDTLSQLVSDYFLLDSVDADSMSSPKESEEIVRARKLLQDTTVKLQSRYETGLLWKSERIVLPDSVPMAKSRLDSVKRSLSKDSSYAAQYAEIIDGYVAKGYARKLSADEAKERGPRTWYLPHFCVRNPHKPGKLRLVFDAAAGVGKVSLNSSLLKGPEQCQDLLTVLHKFREKPIGVCADICEMFHQIAISKQDQDAQRFLWQIDDSSATVDTYVMQVMVFGATCSPCSAEYVKNLNAQNYAEQCPQAVKAIIENHYVDDFVCSFENEDEALAVTSDVIRIHSGGGFQLRKFLSNSSKLLNCLEEGDSGSSTANMDIKGKSKKVLGMHWIPAEDAFMFHLNFHRTSPSIVSGGRYPTKRECLSILMAIYEPFGLLADFTIHGKLMLQSLWRTKTKWDEQIPTGIHRRWRQWILTFDAVERLRVPRCYSVEMSNAFGIQLHIFVDASEEAFAAVGYWRVVSRNRSISTAFIMSKTRCAPLKLTSIPRLELQAAVLGVRLRRRILQSHNIQPARCTLWSDSRTVLNWVKSADPRKYKPFVGHRIAEILELSDAVEWRWVPTKYNVADLATRAKYLANYQPGKWVQGPEFLLSDELYWPSSSGEEVNVSQMIDEELRVLHRHDIFHVSNHDIDLTKFSNFLKLKRVMAWILRWRCGYQRSSNRKCLAADELQHSENVLCRMVQKQHYADEYATLTSGQQIEKSSRLYKLTPCLDECGVIRLSGRIDSAVCVPTQSRRPIILPKDCRLSKLIVVHFHERFHHQNQETIICEVRRQFWIPHLRALAKTVARTCQFCKILSAKPATPQMGQLPEDRLTPFVRPFTFTGVDYMGPFLVAIGRRREKRWIALFTCLTMRAVHLEVAADLSTDAFIICLRNFVNRRGVPVRIRSDNGTNFIGAASELKERLDIFDHDAIQTYLSTKGIQWIFNCPSNPSAGGCWERLVRSVKRVLSVALKDTVPKENTFRSVIIEAENIVNSRPLTHLPVTSDEDEPLTPNHFILGCANSTQTPGPVENGPICLRKQWKIAQVIKDRFWKRWVAEYLPDLTRRTKWYGKTSPLAVGDLVIICDSNVARSCWRRGRIVSLFPGRDGQIRVAEVQTYMGLIKRPVSKLAKLDVGES